MQGDAGIIELAFEPGRSWQRHAAATPREHLWLLVEKVPAAGAAAEEVLQLQRALDGQVLVHAIQLVPHLPLSWAPAS